MMSDEHSIYNEGLAKRSRTSNEWHLNSSSGASPQALGDQKNCPVRPLEASGEVRLITVSKNGKTSLSAPGYCTLFTLSLSFDLMQFTEHRPLQPSTYERVSYVD
jgi:hypothetical protein